MVTKTRSSESMVDMEEMNEFRTDMAAMKKDVAELKALKGEVKEIKGLLLELCKQKSVEEQGEAGANAAAATAKGKSAPATTADAAGPSSTAAMNTTSSEVRFAIEAISGNPMGMMSQGVGTGPGMTNSNQFFDLPRPQPTVPPFGSQGLATHFGPQQNLSIPQFGGMQGRPTVGAPSNFCGSQGIDSTLHTGFNRGVNPGNTGVHIFDQQRNIFGGHMGDGNHYAEAIIKGPRLEIPLFSGEDPIDWLKQCEKFYEISGTPAEQWVNLAIAHLQGKAMKWYRGIGIPWQLITWPQWCAMVSTRFSAADTHEAVELFQNVKQYNQTVEQYIDKFEEYVDLVRREHPYLQEQYLNSCFIGGLRGDIKHDVCGHKPQGLLESYWYAKNYERAANARKNLLNFNRNRFQNQAGPIQGRNVVNRGQPREQVEKKEERKCWFCKEPWFPKHQCKVKKALNALLMEGEEGKDEGEEGELSGNQEDCKLEKEEAPPDDENQEELMFVSHNAVYGTTRPDTFSVIIQINGRRAVGLVDSGSTSTFMDQDYAVRNHCPLVSTDAKKVVVAGGGELKSEVQVPELVYQIQGETFSNKFNIIPLKGYDVILGADWIYKYSPITLDLKKRELGITKGEKTVVIQDFTRPGKHLWVDSKKVDQILRKGGLGCLFQITRVEEEETSHEIPEDIKEILQEFPAVLKDPKGLPPRRNCDHVITLNSGAEPPNLRPYRVPHYQKEAMEKIIAELIESKEIQVSDSPYSSPAVMVRKKDGSWRLCVDYRQLNAQTVKNKFPMPIIEDLLDELNGAKVFSKLDLRSGYHQIRMATQDIPKTAFRTHLGHYEYQVMPFGLTNAPATFQSLMNQVLAPFLRKYVLVFFDDILIYSKDWAEHKEHIRQVMKVLEENKLVIKLKKCAFGLPSVTYLGHIISQDGVATDPKKVEKIATYPTPKSVTDLRKFLGMTGYYRRFIKNYGIVCRPLHDMLKKEGFQWGREQTEAFETLKTHMCTSPVLSLPDFTKEFVIEADACGNGIGAVLMQSGRLLAYFSKTLGPKAAAQSIYEKEAMAILEALKKWRHYVLGSRLIIKTDQQSLKFMMNQRLVEGIQHKLLLKLMEYDYSIEYKAGKENLVADALSRIPPAEQCQAITTVIPEWVRDIQRSYEGDVQAHKILSLIGTEGDIDGSYSQEAGLLRYKGRIYVGENTEIREELIRSYHSSAFGGHSGMRATYHRIKSLFYWPGLKKAVEGFIRECPICQVTKAEHIHIPGLLDPLEVPDMAWAHITMDFVEGLPKSNGKDVILVVVDRLTKYAHFIAMAHPYTVEQVVELFMNNIHRLHGMPMAIITDRDRIFTSQLFQEIFKSMKVRLKLSTSYHPQTDGQTERVNQCLESYLRSMTFQEPTRWHSWLALAEWWYNTTYHTSIQMTPFQALYGYPPPQINEFSVPCNVSEEARVTIEQKDAIIQKLKYSLTEAQRRIKHYADRNRSERTLAVGDMVYLKLQPYRQTSFGIRGSLKLRSKFYGPFKIMEKVGRVAYKLQLPEGSNIHPVFHVIQLKKHIGSRAVPMANLPSVGPDGQIKTEPVAVLKRRMIPRGGVAVTQWLVLWHNLSPSEATWEDASMIQSMFPSFNP